MPIDRYLDRIRVCHTADRRAFAPWFVGDVVAGHVHVEHLPLLEAPPTPFARRGGRLVLDGADFASRSRALADLTARLARDGAVRAPLGEFYPVLAPGREEALLQVDRAVVAWFGVPAAGVHLNGFVRTGDGLAVWVARRALGKRTFPGHLDNLVAGGQSIGMSPEATLRKECHEEAGIPAALAARAVPAGRLDYTQQDVRSLKVDTLWCFDLELSPDFRPHPVDGEVEAFELWPAATVAQSLRGDGLWKPNCALVVLHFLLRTGALDAELSPAERDRLSRALRGEVA